jgi:hydrophobe/amphiphile efflux-3 (HAE3) family protein
VSQIVFDTRQPPGTPKPRFAYLFPNDHAALISMRLRPDLSDAQRHDTIELVRQAVTETRPRKVCAINDRPAPCFALEGGGRYVVSGVPVVVDGLAGILADSLLVLLVAALVVMAITLVLVFRSRLRLLPLALALGAAAATFGLLGLVGGALTMASIAVLPVLIGLAVDYAIQLQARFDEALASGVSGPEAARLAASAGGPVVGAAFIATGAGFLALLVSPVPMVRSFGLLLVVGIGIAFFGALTVGFAALSLTRGPRAGEGEPTAGAGRRLVPVRARSAGGTLGRWRDRVGERVAHFGKTALAVAIATPGRVLLVAGALAACGWAAGTRTEVVSDIQRLVPRDLSAIREVNELQEATGVSGELDVVVRAPDITDPDVISWMGDFKQRVLERHGFRGDFPSCEKARLCPGTSLPDLFSNPSADLTRDRIRALLNAIPAYDSQAVVTRDPRTGEIGHTANVAFGIRVMPLDEQKRLIDDIRSQVDPPGPGNGPPAGVRVSLAGLPVLAADSNADLSGSRYWLTLAGLLCVALALLAVYRSLSRALVPLVPIVLATGWSALVLAAMDIPLNPMSAALGALVIAIATEFSVILAARYQQERDGGHSVGEALRRSYARTGAAVLASGITAIAGFAALIASDIRMLREFGLVTVVDLGVALTGVMLVLPAVLVLAEKGFATGRLSLPGRGRPAPARSQ